MLKGAKGEEVEKQIRTYLDHEIYSKEFLIDYLLYLSELEKLMRNILVEVSKSPKLTKHAKIDNEIIFFIQSYYPQIHKISPVYSRDKYQENIIEKMYFEKASDEIESRIKNIDGDLEILIQLQVYYKSINNNINPDVFFPLF